MSNLVNTSPFIPHVRGPSLTEILNSAAPMAQTLTRELSAHAIRLNNAVIGNGTESPTLGILGISTGAAVCTGCIGEELIDIKPFANRASISTATDTILATITLTPGAWEVSGAVGYLPAATTNVVRYLASLNTTAAAAINTADTTTYGDITYPGSVLGNSFTTVVPVGPKQILVAANTQYSVYGRTSFTVSTMQAFGHIRARRMY